MMARQALNDSRHEIHDWYEIGSSSSSESNKETQNNNKQTKQSAKEVNYQGYMLR